MINQETPTLVFDHHISDLREHSSQANVNVEMRQLDAGQPRARIALLATANIAVMRGEYERAYHKIGESPTNCLTIGVPDSDVEEFRWCGRAASGSHITNFGLPSGFEGTSAPGFSGYVFSIDFDLLDRTCEVLQLNFDFRAALRSAAVFSESRLLALYLRQQARYAFASSRLGNGAAAADFFNFQAPASILVYLAAGNARISNPSRAASVKAARVVREHLEESDNIPLTVSDLSSRLGVSAATLYRAFQSEFGLGPKQYIQYRRLNAVRNKLLDPTYASKIVDVANEWGFWHMGKFAADYRQLFGERPSETLAGVSRGGRLCS